MVTPFESKFTVEYAVSATSSRLYNLKCLCDSRMGRTDIETRTGGVFSFDVMMCLAVAMSLEILEIHAASKLQGLECVHALGT